MAEPQSRAEALAAKKARNIVKAEAKKKADQELEAKQELERQESIAKSEDKKVAEQKLEAKKELERRASILKSRRNLPQKQEGTFAGTPGYSFTLRGADFGSTIGKVMLKEEELAVTSWSAVRVKGQLPMHAEHGKVTATLPDGRTVVARYGPVTE